MAAAIPIAAIAIDSMGKSKAASAAKMPSKLAEAARREAVQYTQPSNIYKMSQWLFPGLLGTPPQDMATPTAPTKGIYNSGTIGGPSGVSKHSSFNRGSSTNQDSFSLFLQQHPEMFGLQPRAQGGPVQPDQPYLVGEQGPEVVVPGQPGQVMPNPGTQAGPGAGPAPMPSPTPPNAPLAQENLGSNPVYQNPYDQFFTNQSASQAGAPATKYDATVAQIKNTMAKTDPSSRQYSILAKQLAAIDTKTGGIQSSFTQQNLNTLGGALQQEQANDAAAPPPAQGNVLGPNGQPQQTPSGLGQLSVNAATNFLTNPGQVNTAQYERQQEQANQALSTNIQGMMGGLTGMGVSPRSGMGQTMMQSAVDQSARMRSEAARDLAIQEETLKRQDILAGMTAYQNFLNQVFGIVGTQAGTAGGGQFPGVAPINPYEGISQGLAAAGNMLANNKTTSSPKLSEGGSTGF